MFHFVSAGESHGPGVISLISGVPSGFPVKLDDINSELKRRQKGYGRGGRMAIERDKAQILSGIRGGFTIGSPVAFLIENKDWENWAPYMDPVEVIHAGREVTRPRPGHADLAGGIKYGHTDLRNVLERASARETAARTAAGALAKIILSQFDVEFFGYVLSIGDMVIDPGETPLSVRGQNAQKSIFSLPVTDEDEILKEAVDKVKGEGDTLGGVVEVVVAGVPPGLGGPEQWYTRLDAKLAAALMSIPAVKGVEVGDGFETARKRGKDAHDEIFFDESRRFYRKTNRAGGIEGGITNGAPIVVRAAMKPIPTLMSPLHSVDIRSKEEISAQAERSDVMAVPALSVIAEAMVAVVLAGEFLGKFGGDNLEDISRSYKSYLDRISLY
ncbi:MAG: chorismate synthase [Deltaproteobacteria bacterium]|uniref:Chorismate synthase n=1 Tax=Candidatus Zymogenus saltonus TaxID=2844893 RepID=A0A9D8PNH1_9DELT|nr:chorismate synthase [Candidatus Zymogenus saltonus]